MSESEGNADNGISDGYSADDVSGCEFYDYTNLGSVSGAPGSLDGCKSG